MKIIVFISGIIMSLTIVVEAQWQQTAGTPQGAGVTDMVVLDDGTLIVTTASYNWPGGEPGGIRRSTDGGNSWQNINNVYNARTLWLGSTGKIFASYWPYPSFESAYYSTNNGVSWNLFLTLSSNNNIFSIASKNHDSTVFLGTRDGIRRTTNNGTSFINLTIGLPANSFVYDLDIDSSGNYIAAGTSKGLYISSNNGNSWVAVSGVSLNDTIYAVKFANFTNDSPNPETKLLAGSSDGKLYKTESELIAATIIAAFFGKLDDIEVVTSNTLGAIYLSLSGLGSDNLIDQGFAYSTDQGVTWTQNNNGLPSSPQISSLTYYLQSSSIKFFAGMFGNINGGAKIYKQDFPIGIQNISSEIPNGFSLSQNYPNPFNPVTNIEFAIPKASFVKLAVYDILGREVESLVNDNLKAGGYRIQLNAAGYTSGAYFYKLITESFSQTRKMILIK